jgi:glycosyltransferase involved in cell wall biosynthesis
MGIMISVLSLGSTRGLWRGPADEDYQRLTGYGTGLARYVLVSTSYRHHHLEPVTLGNGMEAIPTCSVTPLDAFFRMLWIGRGILKQGGFSVVQAQDPFFSGLAACLLGRWFGIPVNVCIYGPNVFDPLWRSTSRINGCLAWVGKWVLRRVDGIQVDGMATRDSLLRNGLSESRIFLKPVVPGNLDGFSKVRRTCRDSGTLRLLAVGRLVPQKDFPALLEAFRILVRERGMDLCLRVVGEGEQKAELFSKTVQDGTSERVEWVGAVSREQMPALMASADVFVLSSRYEGFARVLMEAAASGLPCAATRVSGVQEVLGGVGEQVAAVLAANGRGFIHKALGEPGWPTVPVGDPRALADRVQELCEDSAVRRVMGRVVRRRVCGWLDPNAAKERQLSVWNTLAARAGAGSRAGAGKGPRLDIPKAPWEPVLGRIVVFNLATDSEHPVLGFTTLWLRELARWAERVEVVTMWAGRLDLPANCRVHSVGRELGLGRIRRVGRFVRILGRILKEGPVEGCFSHMNIEFSVLGAPQLRIRKVPLMTWYAHPSLNATLRIADWVSDRVVTSFPSSYPIPGKKVRVIGQGIDTALFSSGPGDAEVPGRILCVGRVSASKDLMTLVRACGGLDGDWHLVILGACPGDADTQYRECLEAEAMRLEIASRVRFEPAVPPEQLPQHYRRCALHVNLTAAGFGDKSALEAMSCGRPCLFANTDFLENLGEAGRSFHFEAGSVLALRQLLGEVLAWTPARRRDAAQPLRDWVEQNHSLHGLGRRIATELTELRKDRTP